MAQWLSQRVTGEAVSSGCLTSLSAFLFTPYPHNVNLFTPYPYSVSLSTSQSHKVSFFTPYPHKVNLFTPYLHSVSLFTPHPHSVSLSTSRPHNVNLLTPHPRSVSFSTPHPHNVSLFTPHTHSVSFSYEFFLNTLATVCLSPLFLLSLHQHLVALILLWGIAKFLLRNFINNQHDGSLHSHNYSRV